MWYDKIVTEHINKDGYDIEKNTVNDDYSYFTYRYDGGSISVYGVELDRFIEIIKEEREKRC